MDRGLLKQIASLSIPAIITNITTPLLALSDTAIVGHMGGAVYLAAIAVGGTVFNMIYWLFGFLRMGSSGMTAQAYGAGDRNAAFLVLYRALMIALSVGVLLILLQRLVGYVAFSMIDARGLTLDLAREYFGVCVWGAPAMLGMFALTGWCIGMQNSRLPMMISIFVDVVNIALSVALVFLFHFGIKGVATGTIVAQWSGFILCLLCVARIYGFKPVRVKELFVGIGRFFRVNTDIFLRTVCLVAVTVWFTRVGAEQGSLMLAVNALLMQLFTIFSFFMDGVGFAAEALCGKFYGAGDMRMLRIATRHLFLLGTIISLLFTILYLVAGQEFFTLLSDDTAVRLKAHEFLGWAVCIPMLSFMAFLWDGVFIGLTHTRMMLLSLLAAMVVYFICYFALFPTMGNHGLWIAFLSYLLTRGIVLTIAFNKKVG